MRRQSSFYGALLWEADIQYIQNISVKKEKTNGNARWIEYDSSLEAKAGQNILNKNSLVNPIVSTLFQKYNAMQSELSLWSS